MAVRATGGFNLREIRFRGGQDAEIPDREILRRCALAVVACTQLYRDEETARVRGMRELLATERSADRMRRRLERRPIGAPRHATPHHEYSSCGRDSYRPTAARRRSCG